MEWRSACQKCVQDNFIQRTSPTAPIWMKFWSEQSSSACPLSESFVTVVAGLHLMFTIVKMWGPNKRLNDKDKAKMTLTLFAKAILGTFIKFITQQGEGGTHFLDASVVL